MNNEEILKALAVNLDGKFRFKGLLEMVDGIFLERALIEGYKALHRKQPELATQLVQLAKEYLEADKAGMVDEAADCIAEIVKMIFKL